MKQVVLDIGNTRIKFAIYTDGKLVKLQHYGADQYADLCTDLLTITADQAIVSTTQQNNAELLEVLTARFQTIEFTASTPLPIEISYKTPETLGDDRKAAVCGAQFIVGNHPFLVITAGTCITYNYFDGQYFVGGAISPGIYLRFNAMHDYTGNLPLVENKEFNKLIGLTTEESMLSGVRQGIIAEVEGIIERYQLLHHDLKVFVCGGDTNFLESNIKYQIFASPNLVLEGLHQILDHNFNT